MIDEQTIADEALAFVLENLRTYTTRDEGAAEKILADFAPDISFIPIGENQEVQGIDEMEAFVRREFEQHPFAIEIDVLWTKVKVLREALAVVELATNMQFSETVAMQLRGTFVCEKQQGRWWIVNLHGSLPAQATLDELWPVEVLRARNEELEREVAARTAELAERNEALQRAHREAQVEAALERVRTRTMTMHHSDELRDVVVVVFEELQQIGLDVRQCEIIIFDETTLEMELWGSGFTQTTRYESYRIPFLDHPYHTGRIEAWQRGVPYWAFQAAGEAKERYDRLLFEETDFKHLPEATKAAIRAMDSFWISNAFMRHGVVDTISTVPLPDDEAAILQRFAKVFEQTYTRFLDLKKAEEQAREAQVEAALERVRARTMAMHESAELGDVIQLVFREALRLGFGAKACDLVILDEATGASTFWISGELDEPGEALHFHVPRLDHRHYVAGLSAWKNSEAVRQTVLEGEVCADYMRQLTEAAEDSNVPDGVKAFIQELRYIVHTEAYMRHGYFRVASLEPLGEETAHILQRFARVFEQTYTRFLDLKQAEAQAREAQIEAALERVRSRAMAMHQSDELREVVAVVFEEMQRLGFPSGMCMIILYDEETRAAQFWVSGLTESVWPESYHVPYLDHPIYVDHFKAWQQGVPYLTVELSGNIKRSYDRLLFEETDFRKLTEATKAAMMGLDDLWLSNALMSFGTVQAVGPEPLPDDKAEILQRFARVFEQTYTRFLDLKKAEEQAREAQIETALERVRARAMAMQSSDELIEVASVLREQMGVLGQPELEGSVVHLYGKDPHVVEAWYAFVPVWDPDADVVSGTAYFPKDACWVTREWMRGYASDAANYVVVPNEKQQKEWNEVLLEAAPEMDSIIENLSPRPTYMSFADFSGGSLGTVTYEPLSEEVRNLQKRAAAVFDLAYRRYEDLQAAEARARQATRQAALDRVRAEIASMRTAADLQRITPLVWRELTTLDVPFFRCGVFIIDEAAEVAQVFLTNSEGKALAALTLGFDEAPLISETVAHWRRDAVYTEQWDATRMQAWTAFLQERGLITTPSRYLDAPMPPERLALHFVPFEQGMLYVGSAELLDHEQLDAVQALADAFAVAYARYEDFQRLEAAKAEVEAALTDLKAAQQQLVHAEKMASLGQLTAGVAHEIKNPLNFINNFAELNEELAQELRDALANGEDIEDLLADLEQNAQVIAQHGKRADSIVHAMMQHASGGTGQREPTDLNALVREHLDLAYHGKRAQVPDLTVEIKRDLGADTGEIEIVPQEIGRVLLNLLGNAFDAVQEKASSGDGAYTPTVRVSTRLLDGQVEIRVCDNGPGIPSDIKDKIFEPFFTTKPTGSGTGLGLSLSYDIVTQGHGGTLRVESEEGKGATFIITLLHEAKPTDEENSLS